MMTLAPFTFRLVWSEARPGDRQIPRRTRVQPTAVGGLGKPQSVHSDAGHGSQPTAVGDLGKQQLVPSDAGRGIFHFV
ncbi:hypothetical protein J6590_105182 [Homalodisca vitripennis]|nr:hypothetical protein J6590_105182 [Homalodisca vitripennis]